VTQAIETARPRWQDEAQGQGVQIAIETDLQATIPIQGTPDELHDILVHPLLNAVDALEQGGTIRIVTSDDEARVTLGVSDDGVGMNTHTLGRVFEPFFTTKAEIGAGLGLATVHGTVSRWGGTISANSQPGEGSEFVLELPRSWEALPVVDSKTPVSIRSGRILIAEDDEIVREVLSESLSKIHDVVIVEDGQKAMDLIQEGRFDVALIDLSLPGVPGDRIARRIRQVDPAVVTVLMTGWDLSEDDPRRVPFDDFIPKPIASIHDVEDVVARSLLVHDARKLRG
jgi:CheY-like chemotaxis protein